MKDSQLKWYFSTSINAGGHGGNDPLTDLFPGERITNLVRESIQNSIDQRQNKNAPVHVDFRLRSLPVSDYPHLMGLEDHIQLCSEQFPTFKKYKDMLSCFKREEMLVLDVSDYNTRGMDYDSEIDSGRFKKFVRYSGDPNDEAGSGGSHGYGKITYFNVSEIRTIIVSSLTPDSRICTFEGVSRLASHKTTKPRETYGDTGFFDRGEGDPVQIKESELSNTVSAPIIPHDFQRTEPGTTVSILFAAITDKAVAYRECCETVLRSFFAAVDTNLLSVSVDLGDGYEIEINQRSLDGIFRSHFFMSELDTVKNKVFDKFNPHPYWNAFHKNEVNVLVGTSIEDATNLCEGKQYIKIHEHLPILGDVIFHVNVHPQGTDTVIFMRKPLMLVNYIRNSGVAKGFYGVFECSNDEGNKLLRQMEDAAHRSWTIAQLKRDSRPKEEIDRAANIEREMNDFIHYCVDKILFPIADSEETEICLDDFTLPVISDDVPNRLIGPLLAKQGTNENVLGAPVQISSKTIKQKSQISQTSQVQIVKTQNTLKDVEGNLSSGRSHGGGGGGEGEEGDGGNDKYKENHDGDLKKVRKKLNVRYRFITSSDELNKASYTLIVNSGIETDSAVLTIFPIGETQDNTASVQICSSDLGKYKGNTIKDVHLNKGKTIVHFSISEQEVYTFSLGAEYDVIDRS